MERKSVDSSNIDSIGYDPVNMTLEVEFVTGSVYQYDNVGQDTYDELMNASSKGSYFYHNIRNEFSYKKV